MFALSLALVGLMASFAPGFAQSIRPFATLPPAVIALLDSGTQRDGARLAAVAIDLQPDFKTYWRTPGDSGLPPRFDWAASRNVKSVDVLWPVPQRFDDQAGSSIGYEGRVILPVLVRFDDPAQEAALTLKLAFGVCKTICIPVSAEASVRLPSRGGPEKARPAIEQALALVPVPGKLGDVQAPGIVAARLIREGPKWALETEALLPATRRMADLYVEGPDSWLFGAAVPIVAGQGNAAGLARLVYRVPLEDAPPDFKPDGTRLTLTITADGQATEIVGTLDAGGALH